MRRTIKIICLLVLSLSLTLGVVPYAAAQVNDISPEEREDLYKNVELFADAVSIISADYVDEVPSKDLIYGALKGMLASLDPHSQFLDPDAFKEIKIDTTGKFGGLGIEITIKDDLLTIITPLDGTPADKAGLQAGDKIVKIDGEITRDITLHDAVKKMRGEPGTPVVLTILREDENRIFDVTVVRGMIEVKSIKKAKILEEGIGYIKLSEFQENTPSDLEEALKRLKSEGMESLILDLRNNPGGLLNISIRVAGKFIDKGKEIVSTKGRLQAQNAVYKNREETIYPDIPLIVLVNGGSASASEIVAGAIKDHKRGVILGTTTFGKGSVQTVIPLKDGSALRLTTAKYFTPSGISIHNKGIVPDVIVEQQKPVSVDSDKEAVEDVFTKIEMEEEGSEGMSSEEREEIKKEKQDTQLQRAIDLMKGIKAFGRISRGENSSQ